jgi:hypothetical protein
MHQLATGMMTGPMGPSTLNLDLTHLSSTLNEILDKLSEVHDIVTTNNVQLNQDRKETEMKQIYRHYKGTVYEVLYEALNSETLESQIVYRDVNNPDKIWVRPKSMFNEKVYHNGTYVDRFQKI